MRQESTGLRAEAVVHGDGTATFVVNAGDRETLTAPTPDAVSAVVLQRAAALAGEHGQAVELAATMNGQQTVLEVLPDGSINPVSVPTPPPTQLPPSAPSAAPAQAADRARRKERRILIGALAALLVAAAAGIVVMLASGSHSDQAARPADPTTAATSTTASTAPAVTHQLRVTAHAAKGGPLRLTIAATHGPLTVTVTLRHAGRVIATRKLHLSASSSAWSHTTATFAGTRAGKYRWVMTAARSKQTSGTYAVPPAPQPSKTATPSSAPSTPAASSAPVQTQHTSTGTTKGTGGGGGGSNSGPVPGGGGGGGNTGPVPGG